MILGDVSIESAKAEIKDRTNAMCLKIGELISKIKKAEAEIKRKEEIGELLPQKEIALEKKIEELKEIEDGVKTKTAENVLLRKRTEELKDKLTFESKEIAENEINSLNEKVRQMESAFSDCLKAVNENNEKIASLKSAKEEILKMSRKLCTAV